MSKASDVHSRRQRVVIVGGGVAAWMAADSLARALEPDDFPICVVGADADADLTPFGTADATLPRRSRSFAAGMDDDELIAATGGSFSHGVALSGVSGRSTTYFHPFGSLGAALGPVAFHQLVLRLRREGDGLRLANYSLAALAAQAGRFARPDADPRSVLSTSEYAMHLDGRRLAQLLRRRARAAGVRHVAGSYARAERNGDGSLRAVTTVDGARVEGELFLDCGGPAAGPAGDLREAAWEDWSPWLPCDRFVAAELETGTPPVPYSHAEANESGWTHYLPLQDRTRVTVLYGPDQEPDRDSGGDERARERLRLAAGTAALSRTDAGVLRYGRRRNAWQRNCIALGSAAVQMEPVVISNLHLLRSALDRLLRLFPRGAPATALAAEYNRQTAAALDRARDFAMLHYKLNGRRGEALWDACRAMPVPDELDYKIRLYEGRGRVPLYDEEPFEEASWVNLFDEHGVLAKRGNPIAEGIDAGEIRAYLDRIRNALLDALGRLPLHAEYLSRLNSRSRAASAP